MIVNYPKQITVGDVDPGVAFLKDQQCYIKGNMSVPLMRKVVNSDNLNETVIVNLQNGYISMIDSETVVTVIEAEVNVLA